jgi:hypothetical protein
MLDRDRLGLNSPTGIPCSLVKRKKNHNAIGMYTSLYMYTDWGLHCARTRRNNLYQNHGQDKREEGATNWTNLRKLVQMVFLRLHVSIMFDREVRFEPRTGIPDV